jgi:hypothetical protein
MSVVIALTAWSSIGTAQAPGKRPAARPAAPAARAAPARRVFAAPRSAAPRQIARSRAPRLVARPPAAVAHRARPTLHAAQKSVVMQRSRTRVRAAEVQGARQRAQQQGQVLSHQTVPDKTNGAARLAAKPGSQLIARVKATEQQRRDVYRGIFANGHQNRVSRNHLKFAPVIGYRIPRHQQLHRFAPAILALVPAYAAYSYLIVDDTICVVDPETYAIVDVIPSSIEQASASPTARTALMLSADQMRCIYSAVPKDQARSDLHLRLALGAEIPRDVELLALPQGALNCAPELGGYRYIVAEDEIVIVDPVDYAIAAVVSG